MAVGASKVPPAPMYFLYLDESGRSGLNDARQPFHVLGGVIVPEASWCAVEESIATMVDAIVPPPRPPGWELHMAHIFHGKDNFTRMPKANRDALVEGVLSIIEGHELTLLMVAINKPALVAQYAYPVDPEVFAYELAFERFQKFLARRGELGVIVADEQKGVEETLRAAQTEWRKQGTSASKQADRILETALFVPSHQSPMLQLADVAAYWCNRGLRDACAGKPVPDVWRRLKLRLDRGERYGLKVFP